MRERLTRDCFLPSQFQRHLEAILYGRIEGSSGPIWKVMNQAGIGSTTLQVNKASVTDGLITQPEFDALMTTFKESLPSDMVDPCSLGRIRNCTIIPLAAAATVARSFGRSNASMAFLRALQQPVPAAWELREQQEQLEEEGLVALLVNEALDEQGFEAEEMSFAEELTTMPSFVSDSDDETRLKTYTLKRVPVLLAKELDTYLLHRTETFAARRQGGAVKSDTVEGDQKSLLRFFGWMAATHRPEVGGDLAFMVRPDLGDVAQDFCNWLQHTQQVSSPRCHPAIAPLPRPLRDVCCSASSPPSQTTSTAWSTSRSTATPAWIPTTRCSPWSSTRSRS